MGLGTLKGTVVDGNDEVVPFVKVVVYSSESLNEGIKAGGYSDFDGKFLISNLSPGIYEVELTNMSFGMDTLRLSNVEIHPDMITSLDTVEVIMSEVIIDCPGPWRPSEIKRSMDPFGRSITIEREDIRRH